MHMPPNIALFLQDKFRNKASAITLRAIVFQRNGPSWNELDNYYVNMAADFDLLSVREEIKKLVERLGGCRIAVGPQLSGVLYRELDNSGFSIFETQDYRRP
jgi:hypothetical protein